VARAYKKWFKGYDEDPEPMLKRTFNETGGMTKSSRGAPAGTADITGSRALKLYYFVF
jgi:hypothetical protein